MHFTLWNPKILSFAIHYGMTEITLVCKLRLQGRLAAPTLVCKLRYRSGWLRRP